MKNRLNQAFTLIELLVVITIIAILASLSMPVFSTIQEKANITKGISNARQLILAIKVYASDNEGAYPEGSDANEAFIELVKSEIITTEAVFGCPASSVGKPDGDIGTKDDDFARACEDNENHWEMTSGLNDSSPGNYPLVWENSDTETWDPSWDRDAAGTSDKGRTWSGGKVIVGINDNSVKTYKTDDSGKIKPPKGGSTNIFSSVPATLTVLKTRGSGGGTSS